VKFRQLSNNIVPHTQRIKRQLQEVPAKAYTEFKKITPIDTGNARRKTNYQSKVDGGAIQGDYPYVNKLNEGSSKQARDGMTRPTIAYIRQLIKRVL
jgi:hypothetical protein